MIFLSFSSLSYLGETRKSFIKWQMKFIFRGWNIICVSLCDLLVGVIKANRSLSSFSLSSGVNWILEILITCCSLSYISPPSLWYLLYWGANNAYYTTGQNCTVQSLEWVGLVSYISAPWEYKYSRLEFTSWTINHGEDYHNDIALNRLSLP